MLTRFVILLSNPNRPQSSKNSDRAERSASQKYEHAGRFFFRSVVCTKQPSHADTLHPPALVLPLFAAGQFTIDFEGTNGGDTTFTVAPSGR